MNFYYDGIDPNEIEKLHNKGILSGVTTNLTLINNERKKTGKSRLEIINPIKKLVNLYGLPLSIQLEKNKVNEMILEGLQLSKEYKNVDNLYIKVPVDFDKLEVIRELSINKINVNATCITAWPQAQAAALAGARIVSFFWGKMSDQGIDPYSQVKNFYDWRRTYSGLNVKILVGSIRQTSSIYSAFSAGSDIVTTNYLNWHKYIDQLLSSEANSIFQETNL
jgi:transaldolase